MLAAQTNEVPEGASPPSPTPNQGAWRQIAEPVKPFLQQVAEQLAEQIHTFHPNIRDYAHYALSNQGKQIRPALVALTAQALGKLKADHATAAVIIEMVHLATLVHDDIMDEADIRRSQPTLARRWGNEVSVLLGDCLFAHALKLASEFPTTEICRAVASATKNVCSGEILQNQRRAQFNLSESEYFEIIEMKTGELFGLSCELGACLSTNDSQVPPAFRSFGMELGTVYQLYDDCLDLFGSEDQAGKSLGTDLEKGKMTLPLILFFNAADEADSRRMRQLLQSWDSGRLQELILLLQKYHAGSGALECIHRRLAYAETLLKKVPHQAKLDPLRQIINYLAQQTRRLGFITGVT